MLDIPAIFDLRHLSRQNLLMRCADTSFHLRPQVVKYCLQKAGAMIYRVIDTMINSRSQPSKTVLGSLKTTHFQKFRFSVSNRCKNNRATANNGTSTIQSLQ